MSLSILVRTLSLTTKIQQERTAWKRNSALTTMGDWHCVLYRCRLRNNLCYLSKMPFLELSLHITDQHLDPWSSWQEIPEREEKFRKVQTASVHDGNTGFVCFFFNHLAKRALAEDFEQFKLRWISLLTALFYMMGDRNLLICPIVLHKQYQYEKGTQGWTHVILHAHKHIHAPRPQAHYYLHSVRETLPPPWARPWSDVHWSAARPTNFIRGVGNSKQFHKACSILVFSWAGLWLQLLHAHMYDGTFSRWNRWVTCNNNAFLFSNWSSIWCQTVWSPYSKPVQLSSCPYKPPHYWHSSLIPSQGKNNMSGWVGGAWCLRAAVSVQPWFWFFYNT